MSKVDLVELSRHVDKEVLCGIVYEAFKKKDITTQNLSLRQLWEAIVGPVGSTLRNYRTTETYTTKELQESAVNSTLYQDVAGKILGDIFIETYKQIPSIGDMLVTNYPTKERFDKIPGFTPTNGLKVIPEGSPYEHTGVGFKYVGTGEPVKKGRAIALTEEAVMFDHTGLLVQSTKQLAEDSRIDKEEAILSGILGITPCYFPSDVSTTLYSTGNTNLVATTPLVDWQSVEAAELAIADVVDEELNSILINTKIMLVPKSLEWTAKRIVNATEVREDENPSAGTRATVTLSPNPLGNYTILSSPLIHKLQIASGIASGVATTSWWLGDPQKQFYWKEIMPLLFQKEEKSDLAFSNDIIARYRARYFGCLFARDHRYFYKMTAS